MEKLIETLEKYVFYLIIFFVPLIVLSSFPNPWGVSKVALLTLGVCLLILLKAVEVVIKGKLEMKAGNFDLVVFLALASYLLAGLLKTPNKMEAFFLPGTATIVIASGFLYYFANSLAKRATLKKIVFASGTTVALVSLLASTGILARLPLPNFVQNQAFTTLGLSTLPLIALLLSILPFGVFLFMKEKEIAKKFLLAVSSLLVIIGLLTGIVNALPGKATSPRLPDFTSSWQIAVESIKESPVLGVGPGNYLTAFNRFRPVSFNQTDNWNLRFAFARSFYLTIISEVGLLGATFIILLAVSLLRNLQEKGVAESVSKDETLSLLLLLGFFVLFPTETSLTMLLFILLSLASKAKPFSFNLSVVGASTLASKIPALFLSLPLAFASLLLLYFSGRAIAAEVKYMRALTALSRNEGTNTYNQVRQAVALNPLVDRYHVTNAQVNMALAQSLASKEEVTEADRTTITQLISQAINEAKISASLNRQRSTNWEILARTYRSIMAFAQGADQFAIQSFSQAVILDPINPNLRIALGGVYYATGDFESAIDAFKYAVLAKNDLANAHYNLAVAYREDENLQKAIEEMTITLALVEKDSADYQLAKGELEALEEKKESETPEATENLTPPETSEPVIEPPIELPSDSEPPGTQEE